MKINDAPEFDSGFIKKLDYIPVVSTFTGIGRVVRSLAREIFGPKEDNAVPKSLLGRVSVWSEAKRGAIASIPIVGNVILYRHDKKANTALVEAIRETSDQALFAAWQEVPKSLQNSRSFIFKILAVRQMDSESYDHGNPHILKYLDPKFTSDPEFMGKIIRKSYKTDALFKESPLVDLMKDSKFVLGLMENLLKRGLRPDEILQYADDLMKDKDFIIKAAKMRDIITVEYIRDGNLCNDGPFILELMAALKEKEMTHQSALHSDPSEKGFVILTQVDCDKALEALWFASDALRSDEEFMEKAREIHPWAVDYASEEVKDKLGISHDEKEGIIQYGPYPTAKPELRALHSKKGSKRKR